MFTVQKVLKSGFIIVIIIIITVSFCVAHCIFLCLQPRLICCNLQRVRFRITLPRHQLLSRLPSLPCESHQNFSAKNSRCVPEQMQFLLVALLLIGIDVHYCQLLEKSRSVWVEQGLVRGNIYNIDGKHIQIFRGIPYAEPPIGDLRFRKPVKKSRWQKELLAIEYGPPCLQFMDFHKYDKYAKSNMERQNEDCLYLNVFSPYDIDDESKTYPILVWIHGGSFLAGSSDTGIDMEILAKNIVSKGVAFVSINYRLGPLGFMNHFEKDHLDGNYGIWDMVMALQWIQGNIKQFNGDPNKVTVMGESAGGAAASLLALSPKTEGLVHQAIIMSGSALAGWAIHRHSQPAYSVDNIVSYLRCQKKISEEDTREIIGDEYIQLLNHNLGKGKRLCNYQDTKINCLSADMSQESKIDCLRKELNFTNGLLRKALSSELGVSKMVVDGDLIPLSGIGLAEKYARVPIMTGVARKEWGHKKALFYTMHQKGEMDKQDVGEQVNRIIENSFHDSASERLSNSTLLLIANATMSRYLETPNKEFSTPHVVGSFQKVESDIEFVAPCQREITSYSDKGLPVYAYSFDYMPESPIYETEMKVFGLFGTKPVEVQRVEKELVLHEKQAFHGLDHAYIFTRGYSSNFQVEPFTKKDETMSRILCNMVTNFVKNGDPSTARFQWPVYSMNNSMHISINIPLKTIEGEIHFPDAQFWNSEAEMITKYIAKDAETALDPDADLTNEERVQLSAYRRSWYALWVLVIVLSIVIWTFVGYCAYRKSKSARNKPYDNILLPRDRL